MGEISKEEFDFEYDKSKWYQAKRNSQIQVASISIRFILRTEKKLKTAI